MFKLAGFSLIFISSLYLFCRKSLSDKFTERFAASTGSLLYRLKSGCGAGKTYIESVKEYDLSKDFFYKTFDFARREDFFERLGKTFLLRPRRTKLARDVFNSLGKEDAESEKEKINRRIDSFSRQRRFYRQRYDKARKINFITGAGFAFMVFIALG